MIQIWILCLIIGLCRGGISKENLCTTSGKFPNDEMEACRGFSTCIPAAGMYYQYDLDCPKFFVYNHLDNQCTNATAYQCLEEYNCSTTAENILYDADENCTSYIACIKGLANVVTARLIRCPANTVFNPMEKICVNATEYECHKSAPLPTPIIIDVERTVSPIITNSIQTVSDVLNSVLVNSAALPLVFNYMLIISVAILFMSYI